MNNNTKTQATNDTQTTNNTNTILGGKIMNNTIKANRQAEVVAKAEAAKAEAREARLAAIEAVDIVETMDEVAGNIAHCVRSEDGYTMGTNGGKLFQEPMLTADGQLTTIAAESKEALDKLKEDLKAGLSGDGKFHKLLIIGGIPCDCCGSTLEELEADIAAAEDYAQAHRLGSVIRDIDVAEQLVDAEYTKAELEQVQGRNGVDYLICYTGNYLMSLAGITIVDLSDLKSTLDREDVKKLLLERLDKWIEENEPEDDDYDDEEEEDY